MSTRWKIESEEDFILDASSKKIDDTLSERAKENNYKMRGFNNLREYNLFRYFHSKPEQVVDGVDFIE